MKKIFVLIVCLSLIFVLIIPTSALTWTNISDQEPRHPSNDNVSGSVFYLRDRLPENVYNGLKHSSFTMYLLIDVYEKNKPIGGIHDVARFEIIHSYYNAPLVSGAVNELRVTDVTNMITFTAEGCLKPDKVYYNGFATQTSGDIVALRRKSWNSDKPYWWYEPSEYRLDFTTYDDINYNDYAFSRFILKYTIDTQQFMQASAQNALGFTIENAQIALNPQFLVDTDGIQSGTPYIGECCIVPRSFYAVFNNPAVYVPRPVTDQNQFYIVSSSNLFSPMTYVPELIAPLSGYEVKKSSGYAMLQNYVFDRSNGTRVTYYQDMGYNPFVYLPESDVGNVYGYTGFTFDNVQTMPYGYKLQAEKIRYDFRPMVGTGTIKNASVGYVYNCNMNRSDSTRLNCNDLRFSVYLSQSYEELYYSTTGVTNIQQIEGVDVSQFYKDITVKFSAEEGIVKGLSRFFADLFTVTLPNIVNNFVVWFMCESPLISTITEPLYLFARVSGNYVTLYVLPLVSSLGVVGLLLFVIFFVKRLIQFTGVNNGG